MSNNIIELRQADGRTVNVGEYENMLSKEITINEGDTVLLKQAFIDTKKSSSNQILIEEDITLVLNNGLYMTDWLNSADKSYYDASGGPGTDTQNGQDYIVYKYIPNGGLTDYQNLDGYQYKLVGNDPVGPLTITYQYVDIYGNTTQLQTTFPKLNPAQNRIYKDPFHIISKNNSFQILSPNLSQFSHMKIDPVGVVVDPTPITENIYVPYTLTTNVVIPSGIYDPSDLADIISKKLSATNTGGSNLINSNFLTTLGKLSALSTESETYLVEQTFGQAIYNASGLSPLLVGAEQVQLAYNVQTNKFEFDYLHSPMRDAVKGQDISVRYLHKGIATTTTDIMAIAKNGGIFFTGLSAYTNSNNKFYDFWAGKLGFNLSKIIATPQRTQWVDLFGSTGRFYSIKLTEGVNITNGYYGWDSAISKATATDWYSLPTLDAGINGITSTLEDTVSLIADNTLSDIQNRYSHFIISADLKFNNNVLGKDIYKQVQSVVTKYYSFQGNYTYVDSSGSIMYQHRGAPIVLKSVRTRILKSDKTVDETLGNDNTVYFQIIKSLPSPSSHQK